LVLALCSVMTGVKPLTQRQVVPGSAPRDSGPVGRVEVARSLDIVDEIAGAFVAREGK
jgi:hypothetical protein